MMQWAAEKTHEYMEYAITASPFNFNEANIIEAVAGSEVGWYITKDLSANNWKAVSERFIA